MSEVTKLDVPDAKLLCWQGDTLFDLARGKRIFLDGRTERYGYAWGFRFDAVVSSPSGNFQILYERHDTKGIIVKNGRKHREINRSCAHADIYDYPVAMFRMPNGREALVHCPEDYDRLHIEDLETGERLTARDSKSEDFFHSRLQVSPDGRWLLSAGWVWGYLDTVCLFDIHEVLRNPSHLDSSGIAPKMSCTEIMAAVFNSSELVAAAGGDEELADPALANTVFVTDVPSSRILSVAPVAESLGTILLVDDSHILSLFKHPKLVNIQTGKIMRRWEEIDSGDQTSSIHRGTLPPMAYDPVHRRLAVSDHTSVLVIEINP